MVHKVQWVGLYNWVQHSNWLGSFLLNLTKYGVWLLVFILDLVLVFWITQHLVLVLFSLLKLFSLSLVSVDKTSKTIVDLVFSLSLSQQN